jgi:TP901 family phage tail tape measure protein
LSGIASQVGNAIKNLEKNVMASGDSIAGIFQNVGLSMMKVGAGMVTAGGVLVGGMYEAAKAAAAFDSEMVMVVTHAGLALNAMKPVGDYLIQLAPKVGIGPDSLADAFYVVQSAVTSLPKPMQNVAGEENILAQSAKLADIGHANLTTTLKAVLAVLSTYGKTGTAVNTVMNVLNKTTGLGEMTFSQFATALGSGILPVAQQAGVSIQSLGASMATLTDLSIPASRAATYLRSALIQITMPSAAANTALEALGVGNAQAATEVATFSSTLAAAGINQSMVAAKLRSTGSLGQTLDWLKQKMLAAGLSTQQFGSFLGAAFGGIRSGTGIASLVANLGSLQQKEKDLTGTTGDFSNSWMTFIRNDPAFGLQQIHAGLQSIDVALGQAFIPLLDVLVQKMVPIVTGILSWVMAHEKLVGEVAEGLATFLLLGGAMMMISGAATFLGGTVMRLLGVFGPFKFLVTPIGGVLKGLAGGLEGLAGAGSTVRSKMSGLGTVFSLMKDGLGTAGKAASDFGVKIAEIGGAGFDKLLDGIEHLGVAKTIIGGLGSEFKMAFRLQGPVTAVKDLFHSVTDLKSVGRVFDLFNPSNLIGLLGKIPGLISGIPGLFLKLGPAILAGLGAIGPAILGAMGTLIAAIGPVILIIAALAAVAFIVGVAIKSHFGQIKSDVSGALTTVTGAVKAAIADFKQFHDPVEALGVGLLHLGVPFKVVVPLLDGLRKGIAMLGVAFNSGVKLAEGFWKTLAKGLGQIHGAGQALTYLEEGLKILAIVLGVVAAILAVLIGGVFKALITTLGVAIPVAIQVAIDVINLLGSVFKVWVDLFTGIVEVVADLLHGHWAEAWTDAKNMVVNVAGDLLSVLGNLKNLIVDLIGGLVSIVLHLITGFVSGIIGAAENLFDTLVGHSIIPDLINSIVQWFQQLPGKVVSILVNMVGQVGNAAKQVGQGILKGITGALSGLGSAISGAVGGAVSGIGGDAASVAQHLGITHLAAGGIVNKPTFALVGEAGPEAVIPKALLQQSGGGISPLPTSLTSGSSSTSAQQFATQIATALAARSGSTAASGQYQANPQLTQIVAALQKQANTMQQMLIQLIQVNADIPTAAPMAARLGA